MTNATKFSHTGQTPGVKAVSRVSARRGTAVSKPSNEAVVYGVKRRPFPKPGLRCRLDVLIGLFEQYLNDGLWSKIQEWRISRP